MNSQVYFTNIMSGFLVSTPAVKVEAATHVAVFIPTITSGALYLQGSWDETGVFGRIMLDDGVVTNIVNNIGSFYPVGSGALTTTRLRGHKYMKFESGILQTDTRTFVITVQY